MLGPRRCGDALVEIVGKITDLEGRHACIMHALRMDRKPSSHHVAPRRTTPPQPRDHPDSHPAHDGKPSAAARALAARQSYSTIDSSTDTRAGVTSIIA